MTTGTQKMRNLPPNRWSISCFLKRSPLKNPPLVWVDLWLRQSVNQLYNNQKIAKLVLFSTSCTSPCIAFCSSIVLARISSGESPLLASSRCIAFTIWNKGQKMEFLLAAEWMNLREFLFPFIPSWCPADWHVAMCTVELETVATIRRLWRQLWFRPLASSFWIVTLHKCRPRPQAAV